MYYKRRDSPPRPHQPSRGQSPAQASSGCVFIFGRLCVFLFPFFFFSQHKISIKANTSCGNEQGNERLIYSYSLRLVGRRHGDWWRAGKELRERTGGWCRASGIKHQDPIANFIRLGSLINDYDRGSAASLVFSSMKTLRPLLQTLKNHPALPPPFLAQLSPDRSTLSRSRSGIAVRLPLAFSIVVPFDRRGIHRHFFITEIRAKHNTNAQHPPRCFNWTRHSTARNGGRRSVLPRREHLRRHTRECYRNACVCRVSILTKPYFFIPASVMCIAKLA